MKNKLLQIKNLKVHFSSPHQFFEPKKTVYALNNLSFDVYSGEILGIVGESGCGKSSLARALVNLNSITDGEIIFEEKHLLSQFSEKEWHPFRKEIQYIFQDSIASLNPRMTVFELIAEPLSVYYSHLSSQEIKFKVLEMMKLVGLSEHQLYRYAQEFSGGQCQRITIARALIIHPRLLICDESISALDVSIKAQIINLLKDLQKHFNLTIIFISHDLSVVQHICDRVLVLYLGYMMELSNVDNLYAHPRHPYTKALLSAIPIPDPHLAHQKKVELLDGELPSPLNPSQGCPFCTRCPLADEYCHQEKPAIKALSDGTLVACFKVLF